MGRRIWGAMVTGYYWFSVALVVLMALWLELAVPNFLHRFADSVTLPNGMILRREFDFSRYGRHDMYAADGQMVLVRGVDMVCFDDRFIEVVAMDTRRGGIFDALSAGSWSLRGKDSEVAQRALAGGHGCNGYYTGMLGPDLLYDGDDRPFLPPCDWRNFANPALRHKDWLLRPCSQDSPAPQAQRGGEDLPPANFP